MNIHIIGIGGIGISALAQAYAKQGITISGSDAVCSDHTKMLEKLGMKIHYTHSEKNIPKNTEKVVYTEAISANNPEFIEAKKRGLILQTYFQALGDYTKNMYTIAICGTHGKTTTTAMVALSLINAGVDPTVIVGSKLREFGENNFRSGKSNIVVVEACEYRDSFLHLYPNIGVVTNCELDHLDYYKSEEQYYNSYNRFLKKIPKTGYVVHHKNGANSLQYLQNISAQIINVDIVENLQMTLPGIHNKQNASLAYAVCKIMNVPSNKAKESLEAFTGTWRRFEIIKENVQITIGNTVKNNITIIDDYAHHPEEIRVTLQAVKEKYPQKKIICVFQPHQYSRTIHFLNAFSQSFEKADTVIIPNIYEARDSQEDKNIMNTQKLVNEIKKFHGNVHNGENFEKTLEYIYEFLADNSVVITMGAGDVWKIAKKV